MTLPDFGYIIGLLLLYLLFLNMAYAWLFRVIFHPFEAEPLFWVSGLRFYERYFGLVCTSIIITIMYSFAGAAIAVFVSMESKDQHLEILKLHNYIFIAAVLGTLCATTTRVFMRNERFRSISNGLYFQMLVLSAAVALFLLPIGPLRGAMVKDIFNPVFDTVRQLAPTGYIVGIVGLQLVSVLINEIFIHTVTKRKTSTVGRESDQIRS